MPRSNKGNKRFGSMSEDTTRRTSGGGLNPSTPGRGSQLPTLGPIENTFSITDPVNGYVFKNNPLFAEFNDRIQVMMQFRVFDLRGVLDIAGNGSTRIAGSAIDNLYTTFWTQIYTLLDEMAQKRDGYKTNDSALHTPLRVAYRDSLIVMAKSNIRTLWALFHAGLVNEGMRSTSAAFARFRSRLNRILESSNTLIYPAKLDAFIDYWSTVSAPYGGGPVMFNYFDMAGYCRNGHGGLFAPSLEMTEWVGSPDWTDPSDIEFLIADLEHVFGVLTRYESSDVNVVADLKRIQSLYSMMGVPTPQTGVKGLQVTPARFFEEYQRYGYLFVDSKGAGTTTHTFWPDMKGSIDTLINYPIGDAGWDEMDMIGAKGIYAWDADESVDEGFAPTTQNLTSYGLVGSALFQSAYAGVAADPTVMYYTREDGWITQVRILDLTSASGVQAALWQLPVLMAHPQGWKIIASEEAEEDYRSGLVFHDPREVQIPVDMFGQAYRRWVYDAYGLPFIT